MENISLFIHNIMHEGYNLEGIYQDDPSTSRDFLEKIIQLCCNQEMAWLYHWWLHILRDVFAINIKFGELQDQDYIKIHDLLEIIIFINPQEMQKMLTDPKLFRSLKLIRLKTIVRKHHDFTKHSAYYVWIIYRWIHLHLNLQRYI